MTFRIFHALRSKLAESHAHFEAFGAVAVLATAAALFPFLFGQDVDNRIEQWVNHNSTEAIRYREFRDQFGSDEVIIVEYSGKPFFTEESLTEQTDLLARLEQVPEIESIFGIPAVYREVFGLEDPEELESEFTSTDFYRNVIISADGAAAGLLIEANPSNAIDARRGMVTAIHDAIAPFQALGWTTRVVGPPVLNVSLDNASRKEVLRLIPASLVASILVLLLIIQSVRAVFVGIAGATITLTITVGTMAAFGRPLNMVTASMPALVWVLSLAGLIHLLHAFLSQDGGCPSDRLAAAIRQTRRPCAISAITTACGFFSLAIAPMRAVRDFGFFAGIGLLVSFLVTFTLATTLLRLFKMPARQESRTSLLRIFVNRFTGVALSHPATVILVSIGLVLCALLTLPRLQTESNPLSYLSPSSEVSMAYRKVPEELTGLYTLELLIKTPESWLRPNTLQAIDGFARQVEAMPEVARVLSPVSYLRKLNQWDHEFDPYFYKLPQTAEYARALVEGADDESRLFRFAREDETAVRLSALVRVMDSASFRILVERVRSLPGFNDLHVEMTGVIHQLVKAQDTLVVAQLRSLAFACPLVFVCILIGVRSFPLTLISFLPNAIPILAVFGLMAALSIRLDAATVMIAGIAIGIAVDDTVHMLCAYQRESSHTNRVHASLRRTIANVGPSITITTVITTLGFLVLLSSEFIPLRHFGLIASSALVVALCADLLVLPAALTLASRWTWSQVSVRSRPGSQTKQSTAFDIP